MIFSLHNFQNIRVIEMMILFAGIAIDRVQQTRIVKRLTRIATTNEN